MPQFQATCQQCGKVFAARRTTARFCGGTCRQQANRAKSSRGNAKGPAVAEGQPAATLKPTRRGAQKLAAVRTYMNERSNPGVYEFMCGAAWGMGLTLEEMEIWMANNYGGKEMTLLFWKSLLGYPGKLAYVTRNEVGGGPKRLDELTDSAYKAGEAAAQHDYDYPLELGPDDDEDDGRTLVVAPAEYEDNPEARQAWHMGYTARTLLLEDGISAEDDADE